MSNEEDAIRSFLACRYRLDRLTEETVQRLPPYFLLEQDGGIWVERVWHLLPQEARDDIRYQLSVTCRDHSNRVDPRTYIDSPTRNKGNCPSCKKNLSPSRYAFYEAFEKNCKY